MASLSSSLSKESQKREDEYRAKDDARTLTDAEAIHGDYKRLKGAHKHLKHSAAALHKTMARISTRKSNRR